MFTEMDMELIKALMTKVEIQESIHGSHYFNSRNWKLGNLLIATDNLKTHKKLRNIGDKSFEQLKIHVKESKEYKCIVNYFNPTITRD